MTTAPMAKLRKSRNEICLEIHEKMAPEFETLGVELMEVNIDVIRKLRVA
jgi:hypothetical protein